MAERRWRRHAADPPSAGRRRGCHQFRIVEAAAASQDQAQHVGRLSRKLQPTRGQQPELAFEFTDDTGQIGMPETLLHRLERILSGLDEDQPTRIQASAGQSGGEEVALAEDP